MLVKKLLDRITSSREYNKDTKNYTYAKMIRDKREKLCISKKQMAFILCITENKLHDMETNPSGVNFGEYKIALRKLENFSQREISHFTFEELDVYNDYVLKLGEDRKVL